MGYDGTSWSVIKDAAFIPATYASHTGDTVRCLYLATGYSSSAF